MFNDAKHFGSQGALAGLRGKASADVEQAFGMQQQSAQRALQRQGVNPGSNRAIAAMAAGGSNAALAKVQTANQMTENRKLQGVNMRTQAANVASGFPAASNAAMGLGNQSLGGASALGAQGLQSALGIQGATQNGFGQANSAMGSVSSGFGALNSAKLNAWGQANQAQATESAGYGSAVGAGLGMYAAFLAASDRSVKQNIVRLGERTDGLGIYSFEYKPEYQAQWGEGERIGLMADEVEKLYPEAVLQHADGYKVVDYSKVM